MTHHPPSQEDLVALFSLLHSGAGEGLSRVYDGEGVEALLRVVGNIEADLERLKEALRHEVPWKGEKK